MIPSLTRLQIGADDAPPASVGVLWSDSENYPEELQREVLMHLDVEALRMAYDASRNQGATSELIRACAEEILSQDLTDRNTFHWGDFHVQWAIESNTLWNFMSWTAGDTSEHRGQRVAFLTMFRELGPRHRNALLNLANTTHIDASASKTPSCLRSSLYQLK